MHTEEADHIRGDLPRANAYFSVTSYYRGYLNVNPHYPSLVLKLNTFVYESCWLRNLSPRVTLFDSQRWHDIVITLVQYISLVLQQRISAGTFLGFKGHTQCRTSSR
jgi:hypothetical protein